MIPPNESDILQQSSLLQQNQSKHDQSYPSQLGETNEPEQYQVLVRRSDLDDAEEIMKLMTAESKEAQDLLYDYPKLVKLFEQSYLSTTVLNAEQQIIGCFVFNDYPQGLTGMIDFQHENFWEYWLFKAFNFDENICITPHNTLFLVYMFIAKDKMNFINKEELVIVEKVFQNVYSTIPRLEGIFYLKRGETLVNNLADMEVKETLDTFFTQVEVKDREVFRQVRGIHYQSELYFSPKYCCTEKMEIRMAREQDHDDLAEIFNRQSEVLTKQFGEFFLADLIATQNQTRRIAKQHKTEGKAIVGQVGEKAVGLMSVSTEIDYKLLAQCFELDTYDNLFKNEFMEAVRNRRLDLIEEKKWKQIDEQKEIMRQLAIEQFKCDFIGQRMTLQQHLVNQKETISQFIESKIKGTEEIKMQMNRQKVEEMIDGWLQGYIIHQPSDLFKQYPEFCQDIQTTILSPRQLLLETLEFFGLPKDYMLGAGHWKNYRKQKEEDKRSAQLKKPTKKMVRKFGKKKKEEDKKEEEEFKLPPYFDLTPFKEAFEKFVSVDAELRTQFRQEIEKNFKQVIMLFCNKDGEMKEEECMDLNELGQKLFQQNMSVPQEVQDNMAQFLECFGNIKYTQKQIVIQVKEEKDPKLPRVKEAPLKKLGLELNEPPKEQIKIQKLANYRQFQQAIETYKKFDIMMNRLQYTKSKILAEEVKQNIQDENLQREKELQLRVLKRQPSVYDQYMKNLQNIDQIPDVPKEAQNAVVINLFCIDENYESRSMDFVEYAFSLFPDREYIILTQPFTVQETVLLQNFIQIPMKKNSTFEHVLYIFHRDALQQNSIYVRKAKIDDVEAAQPLFSGLLNSQIVMDDTIEAIKNLASKKKAFSVFCDQQLIGMYVVSKSVNLDYYVSHFCIQDHILLSEHSVAKHTKLLHSVLNPLFQKSTRFILKEILRLTNKTCLYFEVNQNTLLPDIFNELVFVRARTFPHFLKRKWDFEHDEEQVERQGDKTEIQDGERDAFDQEESMFSLAMITKRMLSSTKISNNSRIVVVGPSDTGVSFLESLLSIKDVNFTHLTLLAPGGLITQHIDKPEDQLKMMSTNYTMAELRNLMLDARVQVLDAKMIKLFKKNKKIRLDKMCDLPYDILVVTVGLIDQELQTNNYISAGFYDNSYYHQIPNKKLVQGVYSIDDPYLYRDFKKINVKDSNIDQLTRKKRPQNITVYGRSLHSIAFISGLLNRGVKPERINFVIPPRDFEKKALFKTNQERLEYEDKQIFDPDPFEDEVVEQNIMELLLSMKINIKKGYTLSNIQLDQKGECCQMVTFKKNADDYDQIQELIEKKKQEIAEMQANLENQMKGFEVENQNPSDEDLDEENQKPISPEDEIKALEQKLYDIIDLPSRFLVTSRFVDIDQEIFFIIHENGLVYNGRLITKSNFQTTENEIFCCGKICEFSQRYKNDSIGRSLRQDKYNGRELGIKLSKCILEKVDLNYLTDQMYNSEQLPNLYMPIGIGAFLPNKLYYYYIRKNDWARPKLTLDSPQNRKPIVSNNINKGQGHYLNFKFDNNGFVDAVTYLGSEAISMQSLTSFVGLSEKYFNKLDTRIEHQLIPNVSEFLSENWAIALYHEWFSEFRHLIKNDILQNQDISNIMVKASKHAREGKFLDKEFYEELKKQISPEIISSIQEGTLDFIRENQNHLPMYYIPPKKVQTE